MSKGKTTSARISRTYAPHLDAIAGIFVEENQQFAATLRRVRAELGLPITHTTIHRWHRRQKPEWAAALDGAREARQLERRSEGNLRGKKFLDWCRATESKLRDDYEALAGRADLTPGEVERLRAALETRILRLADAARSEEKHLEDQRTREAVRDMGAFGRKLLKALANCGLSEAALKVLNAVAKDPAGFMRDDE